MTNDFFCGCSYRYWDNPITGANECVRVECSMHDPSNPAAKYLTTYTCWESAPDGTSKRVIRGHTDHLLHGLYQELVA